MTYQPLAGPNATQAMLEPGINQPFTIRLGNVSLRTGAGISIGYNDNINLAKTARDADSIETVSFNLGGNWQPTDINNLSFNLGWDYQWYNFNHGQSNDSFLISPDSQLQFNILVGDFKITLHEGFAYQNDPISVGEISNDSNFSRFTNDAGLTVYWDLDDVTASLGYDHDNLWVFQKQYSYLDNQVDVISPAVEVNLSKAVQVGVNTTFSDTQYSGDVQNNSTGFTAGPFVTAQLSDFISVNGQVGYTMTNFNRGGLNGDSENSSTYYYQVGVSHRINDTMSESVTGGRQTIPGITSNFTDRTFANYSFNWQATTYLSVNSNLWYENLDDSEASTRQTADRYGAGLNLSYGLTDHASVGMAYQYVLKVADPSYLGYYQDSTTLGFNYEF